jgi:hypothetical protein
MKYLMLGCGIPSEDPNDMMVQCALLTLKALVEKHLEHPGELKPKLFDVPEDKPYTFKIVPAED